ncbi:MAG: hypothetical protein JWM87_792 [Candidatus Eremiobacteraeota bacterium]|nr:hypothetical protein [Candidatus Eremiobacteraeota bacterium]
MLASWDYGPTFTVFKAGMAQEAVEPNVWIGEAMQSFASPLSSEYERVAQALGFTKLEVDALVRCNDAGLSFAEIADLIEAHPVVFSAAMTPRRKGEETDFVALCDERLGARAGAAILDYVQTLHFDLGTDIVAAPLVNQSFGVTHIAKPTKLWTPSGAQRSRAMDPQRRARIAKEPSQQKGTAKRRAANKRDRVARRVGHA